MAANHETPPACHNTEFTSPLQVVAQIDLIKHKLEVEQGEPLLSEFLIQLNALVPKQSTQDDLTNPGVCYLWPCKPKRHVKKRPNPLRVSDISRDEEIFYSINFPYFDRGVKEELRRREKKLVSFTGRRAVEFLFSLGQCFNQKGFPVVEDEGKVELLKAMLKPDWYLAASAQELLTIRAVDQVEALAVKALKRKRFIEQEVMPSEVEAYLQQEGLLQEFQEKQTELCSAVGAYRTNDDIKTHVEMPSQLTGVFHYILGSHNLSCCHNRWSKKQSDCQAYAFKTGVSNVFLIVSKTDKSKCGAFLTGGDCLKIKDASNNNWSWKYYVGKWPPVFNSIPITP